MVFCSVGSWGLKSCGNARTLPETVHRVQLPGPNGNLHGVTLGGYPGMQGLIVIDTGSSRVVRQWNDQNPNERIEAGYAILDVNGITDPKEMLEEFRSAKSINMLVNIELSREQRAVFKQSVQLHNKSRALGEILQPVGPDAALAADVCAICHDDMDQLDSKVAQLPCGHQFHHACVGKWLISGKPRCPLCNCDLKDKMCRKDPKCTP